MNTTEDILSSSIRKHLWGAGLFLCALLAFVVGWAAWMQISGAIIAPGSLVVEGNVKTVKHKEGGIVAEIRIRDGDHVEAGDLLLRLDDATTSANLAVVSKQLNELMATEARLVAERDGLPTIRFPAELAAQSDQPDIRGMLDSQRRLMAARTGGLAGRVDQLREQIRQLESQGDGLKVQTTAKSEEIGLIVSELTGLENLLEQQFVSANRVLSVQRDKTRLTGEHGALLTETARTGMAISERRVQIMQLEEDYRAQILQQLYDTRSEIHRLSEQKVAAQDQLTRMDIRAPRDGIVHQLNVHTRGGVLSPAEPILKIVPQGDPLVIETRLDPKDVDQVHVAQAATIRLPGLNQRTTPELQGEVLSVSAETTRDEVTGMLYFTARLRLNDGEIGKIANQPLVPGMPVEALIKTRDRTILSYLIKPIRDQIAHALKEE